MVFTINSFLVTLEKTNIILEQMKKYICTIYSNFEKENEYGTRFFCIIPYKNQILKVLITASFIVENQLKKNKIKIKLNDEIKEIKINDDRKIYLNKEYSTAIIEINPSKDGINDFLELEENKKNYERENIYILQCLDKEQSKCVSYGTKRH